jgi:hypothetical protein
MRDEEAKRIAQAQRDFDKGATTEKEAKAKLGKIADDVKKAEDDPESFVFVFARDAPEPESTPAKTRTPAGRPGRP